MPTKVEKIELLSLPFWSVKDIMTYFGVSRKPAEKMKERAIIKANGGIEGMPYKVLADSVLKLYGNSSREKEISILK